MREENTVLYLYKQVLETKNVPMQLMIPLASADRVIGDGGERLRATAIASGARLSTARKKLGDSDDTMVIIMGNLYQKFLASERL